MDVPALLQKYDRPVPRYTSYPTAIHFNHDISQEYYAGLLGGLTQKQPLSLYVHIPFCHVLCHYCGCHTKVANSYGPVKSYVQTVLKEIDLVGGKLAGRMPVSHLHFGGGSPNFLKPEDLDEILQRLKQYFEFGDKTETAIETDPRLLNTDKIKALAGFGFTRISLGVQDFNPDVQEAVNRIQPFEKVQESVVNLRKVGINKINFDLMTGLPLQTLESVKHSAEQAVSLFPDRLAVFAYAHVPWMKKHQKLLEKYALPDAKLRFDMMMCVKETLEASGYHAIGIDHFAHETDSLYIASRQGTLRRNFQGYTDDQAQNIVSFGLSSISAFEGAYVQNTTDAPSYRKAIEAGEFPVMRGRILSDEDLKRRAVIEKIMCGFETDISAYPHAQERLVALAEDHLVKIDGDCVKISPEGWPFARLAASCFDAYYEPQPPNHSQDAKSKPSGRSIFCGYDTSAFEKLE
jgi:oxygen-independent coproporphyrinogen-3 oxidase